MDDTPSELELELELETYSATFNQVIPFQKL